MVHYHHSYFPDVLLLNILGHALDGPAFQRPRPNILADHDRGFVAHDDRTTF